MTTYYLSHTFTTTRCDDCGITFTEALLGTGKSSVDSEESRSWELSVDGHNLSLKNELTGINAIMLYSNTMFKKTGLENPRIGTYFLGIAGSYRLSPMVGSVAPYHNIGRTN